METSLKQQKPFPVVISLLVNIPDVIPKWQEGEKTVSEKFKWCTESSARLKEKKTITEKPKM